MKLPTRRHLIDIWVNMTSKLTFTPFYNSYQVPFQNTQFVKHTFCQIHPPEHTIRSTYVLSNTCPETHRSLNIRFVKYSLANIQSVKYVFVRTYDALNIVLWDTPQEHRVREEAYFRFLWFLSSSLNILFKCVLVVASSASSCSQFYTRVTLRRRSISKLL